MTGEGFAVVPTWMIRDASISGHAVLVYATLATLAGYEDIHPSQQTLAEGARCKERTVREAIKELEALGVIERVKRKSKYGRATDGYILKSGRAPKPVGEVPAGDAGTSSESDENRQEMPVSTGKTRQVTPYIEINKKEINNLESEGENMGLISFDRFYREYPRKVGKEAARKRYEQLVGKDEALAGAILSGAQAFARATREQNTETRFIPHPATWLNAGRWEDEIADSVPRTTSGTAASAMMERLAGFAQPARSQHVREIAQ